jgi:hypothetical protein
MKLRHKLIKAGAIVATALFLSLASPKAEQPFGIRASYGQTSKRYNPDTSPLAADSRIASIAKKAKAGSDLDSAKKLHSLLRVATGGLKESKLARSTTKDEMPKTANETMQTGGDCSEFSYVVMAALRKMGFKKIGLVYIDLGASSANTVVMHTIAYVEINGKKYLVDPQLSEFGKGGATTGKRVTFTYEELVEGRAGVRFVRDSPYPSAAAAYHFEWGTYLEGKRKTEEALAAFKKASTIDPNDHISKKKVAYYSALLFNQLMKKAKAAVAKKQWAEAAQLNENALEYADKSNKKLLGSLYGNLGICYFNSNDFQKAAIHFTKAFELTRNKQFEQYAKEAKKRMN